MIKKSWKLRARTGGMRRKITKEYLKIIRSNIPSIETQAVDNTTVSENQSIEAASSVTSSVVKQGSVHEVEVNMPEHQSNKVVACNDGSVYNIEGLKCDDCNFSESEYNMNMSENNNLSFREKLRTWAIENKITHSALNKLTAIINEQIPGTLPTDARTILHTPSHIALKNVEGGQYWHNGITNPLIEILQNWLDVPEIISLNINVDGLPIFKSSSNEFWPILCNIFENPSIKPLVIGIYFGKGKPKKLNEFLEDFVNDMKKLLEDGLQIQPSNKNIKIKIRCFICDSPARAYIKGKFVFLLSRIWPYQHTATNIYKYK